MRVRTKVKKTLWAKCSGAVFRPPRAFPAVPRVSLPCRCGRGMAAFAHPASAQKSEHELLERSKRLLEDKLRALQVRDPPTHRSLHGHQGCPVPPQAEEADLRAKLDECAKQAPGEEALLMIGHLPPSRPRGQGVAELQEVPPSVDAVATPRPPWATPVFHKVRFCIQEHPPGRRTDAMPQLTVQPNELEPARPLRRGPHPNPNGLQVAARQPASAEGADGGANPNPNPNH